MAHIMRSSGAINAMIMILMRDKTILKYDSEGAGMLGWIANQVHEKTVIRQLQMMSHFVREVFKSAQVGGGVS